MSAFEAYVKNSLVRRRGRRAAAGGLLIVHANRLDYDVATALLYARIAFGLGSRGWIDTVAGDNWLPTPRAVRVRYGYFGQIPGEGRLARSLRSIG